MRRRPHASRFRTLSFFFAIGAAGCAASGPDAAPPPPDDGTLEAPAFDDVVDATSLERKMLFGYQGWFLGPGDG